MFSTTWEVRERKEKRGARRFVLHYMGDELYSTTRESHDEHHHEKVPLYSRDLSFSRKTSRERVCALLTRDLPFNPSFPGEGARISEGS